MNTIINEKKELIEIKKSKFISIILKIDDINSIKDIINNYKKEYPKATHYCYAYSVDGLKKSSDDGEPGGSAGVPIMEIINKNDLNHVLVIVIRYFGGIKLGMGGLIRAYSEACRVLVKDNIKEEINGYKIRINTTYQEQSKLDNILKDYIIEKKYDNTVQYIIKIPVEKIDLLNNIDYEIIDNILI